MLSTYIHNYLNDYNDAINVDLCDNVMLQPLYVSKVSQNFSNFPIFTPL